MNGVRNRQLSRGFSLLEVMASIVIMSLGVVAAARMQMTAIGASIAPTNTQEFSTMAREALESFAATGIDPSGTVNGFAVTATREDCTYGSPAGASLTCAPGTVPVQLERYTVTVTDTVNTESLTISTLRTPRVP